MTELDDDRLLVMDILRSSMNDGPGVRTTVFVKGCPLRCTWCHNPESQSPRSVLSFDSEKCVYCGECEQLCPNKVHGIAQGIHRLDRELCQTCGRCVAGCPVGGLKVVGKPWGVREVVDLVLRDKPYYDRSGGGVTISGGEPMVQRGPVLQVLKLCREAGVHTCLDTCGQAQLGHYLQVLPYVSLFLWDYKATGERVHRELMGVDGKLIGANLHSLYEAGARIRLRCPLIPGVNDSPEHLQAIARLDRQMPGLDGIDIMPYHSYGRNKAAKVGMTQLGLPEASADQRQIDVWISTLRDQGCTRAVVG